MTVSNEEHAAWVADTLERLGPRPETRLIPVRSAGELVPLTFAEYVAVSLTLTPDEVLLKLWPTYTIDSAGLRAC